MLDTPRRRLRTYSSMRRTPMICSPRTSSSAFRGQRVTWVCLISMISTAIQKDSRATDGLSYGPLLVQIKMNRTCHKQSTHSSWPALLSFTGSTIVHGNIPSDTIRCSCTTPPRESSTRTRPERWREVLQVRKSLSEHVRESKACEPCSRRISHQYRLPGPLPICFRRGLTS